MRQVFFLIAVSPLSCHSAVGAPVNYSVSFAASGGLLPAGAFTYDASIPQFTNFVVYWDGIQFDLTSAANGLSIASPPSCLGGATGPAAVFKFLLQTGCDPSFGVYEWFAIYDGDGPGGRFTFLGQLVDFDAGEIGSVSFGRTVPFGQVGVQNENTRNSGTFTATAVPEPATLLSAALIGVLLACRERRKSLAKFTPGGQIASLECQSAQIQWARRVRCCWAKGAKGVLT